MYTLGINAAFHDSAACLVRDGVVLAAAEEERFTRIKHAKRPLPFSTWELPFAAIDYCLGVAGIRLADVQHVAYSFDPVQFPGYRAGQAITLPAEPSLLKAERSEPTSPPPSRGRREGDGFPGAARVAAESGASPWDPLFVTYVINAPRQLASGAPHHLRQRFEGVTADGPYRWHFVEHHLAHEASAFLASPFDAAAVMTLDGRGERATTTFGVYRSQPHGNGRGNGGLDFRRLKQIDMPHSLGMLYEEVTRYLGFLHSSDEYKVMALASYGAPRYLEAFHEIVQVNAHGDYRTAAPELERRFGPPRRRGEPFEARHADVAASLQRALEETVIALATWLREASGQRRLCMAGGVALNCVMNARLRDRRIFDEIWVQPAAGDAGTALGAALWIDANERRTHGAPARAASRWRMTHAYLGPEYSDDDIERVLAWARVPHRRLTDVAEETAALLAANRIVGWFQGRMEFGPRALGARSILASPLDAEMQARLNELKDREDFRPVAPAVLEERLADWFVNGRANGGKAPFMLFIYDVVPERAVRIPAAVHVDGTARVQTVDRATHRRYYDLLAAFERRTGVPVLINTSFNSRGDPIVCTPRDALESFYSTPLDALVIGSFLVEKAAR